MMRPSRVGARNRPKRKSTLANLGPILRCTVQDYCKCSTRAKLPVGGRILARVGDFHGYGLLQHLHKCTTEHVAHFDIRCNKIGRAETVVFNAPVAVFFRNVCNLIEPGFIAQLLRQVLVGDE